MVAEAGRIFRSDDGGAIWWSMPSPSEGSFFGVLPLEQDSLLLFGLRGHLFRSDDGAVSWSPRSDSDVWEVIAAVLCLLAATTGFSKESAEQAELTDAIDRWKSLDALSFSYDFQQLCNCLPEAKAKVHIVVADGEIETLVFAENMYYRHQDRHDPDSSGFSFAAVGQHLPRH